MLIGHQIQWGFLKKITASGQAPHALLFSGQNNLGKKKVALEFIKLLNCQNKQGDELCGQCFSCVNFENQRHPDLLVINPNSKEIKIDQIRDLQKFLSYSNQMAEIKAVIIDEAHSLNQEAQSCLLKCLEEPSFGAMIILITSQPEELFATIRSRCEEIKFYPLAKEVIKEGLFAQQNNLRLAEIIDLADGRPGLAISFLADNKLIENRLADFKMADHLLKSGLTERMILIKDYYLALSKNSQDDEEISIDNSEVFQAINQFLENLLIFLRNLLKKCLATGQSSEILTKLIQNLRQTEDLKFLLINSNINKRLLLENLVINL
ncbi:MAG: DNA polymerase III subunit delta' [Candidatus Gribaldobacteria bacterium]|nr:DNA polymerase III subunit delta' [Candidatus Gribaldobacteria bacterium]